METSIFISKIFGSIYLLFGVGMLISREYYLKMFDEFMQNGPILYITGIFIVILGWFMMEPYSSFVGDWTDIYVVITYLIFIKGSIFLLFPSKLSYFKKMLDYKIIPYLLILLGIIFCYFGFVMN